MGWFVPAYALTVILWLSEGAHRVWLFAACIVCVTVWLAVYRVEHFRQERRLRLEQLRVEAATRSRRTARLVSAGHERVRAVR